MAEEATTPAEELTSQDRWLSCLSYFIWIIALVVLLADDLKKRPFLKYHAVQGLAGSLTLLIVASILACLTSAILGAVTFFIAGAGGLCGMIFILAWLGYAIYLGVKAYQGDWVEIPVVTKFCKDQGWI